MLDVGAGLSVHQPYWWSNAQLPLGLRVSYRYSHELIYGQVRTHEIGGGVFFVPRLSSPTEMRVGLDATGAFIRLDDGLDGRKVTVMVRLDYYLDVED